MIISIASGKGGTGKTTVATSLAQSIPDHRVAFLDCDVEAPDAHLFLRPNIEQSQESTMFIPQVDAQLCQGHQRCNQVCQYHALVNVGGHPLVFPELCHGCGSCTLNCPEGAIRETPRSIGLLERGYTADNIHFARGKLRVGEPMAVPVIRQLKRWVINGGADVYICDSPPGTSCPVVESIRGADFVLLVTEPTPFGFHDLRLALRMVAEMQIVHGVILNKVGIGNLDVEKYCAAKGIPILMRIPIDRRIAEALARGCTLVDSLPGYRPTFSNLFVRIADMVSVKVGVL